VTIALSASPAGIVSVPASITIRGELERALGERRHGDRVGRFAPVSERRPPGHDRDRCGHLDRPAFAALDGSTIEDVVMQNQNNDAPGSSSRSRQQRHHRVRGTATIQFTLLSQPTAPVTIPLSISDATEGTLSAGVTSITIQPADWNTPTRTRCSSPASTTSSWT